MSFTPSIRECAQRLQALGDTPALAQKLRSLAHDSGVDPANVEREYPELFAAALQLEQLHELAHHMSTWLTGGHALPRPPVRR